MKMTFTIAAVVILAVTSQAATNLYPALTPAQDGRDIVGLTPDQVVGELARDVEALSVQFPELSDFPNYDKNRKTPGRIVYSKNLKPIETKRTVRPNDFTGPGIDIRFELWKDDEIYAAPVDRLTSLEHLRLTLYTELSFSEDTTPGIQEELTQLFAKYRAILQRMNEAANQAFQAIGDPGSPQPER